MIEPTRTSPAAKTPGWLVSSRNGSRASVQCGESAAARPVTMKPLLSVAISVGSQPMRGIAPMKVKTAGVAIVRNSPVAVFSTSTASSF
ncbi:hypothetical protein BH23GEM7_BH23GEM7_15130 [soil metagenome]